MIRLCLQMDGVNSGSLDQQEKLGEASRGPEVEAGCCEAHLAGACDGDFYAFLPISRQVIRRKCVRKALQII